MTKRVSFEIERQEVADALQAQASAHGRTIEEEIAGLVERTYSGLQPSTDDTNWVEELISLAGGVGLRIPERRDIVREAPNYPDGMEPGPEESFIDHITRISRPGIEFEAERDRAPHGDPRV